MTVENAEHSLVAASVPPKLIAWIAAFLWALLLFVVPAAQATIYWEDYRGQKNVSGDNPGPDFDNYPGNSATARANLREIAANSSNAVRNGTSTSINYQASTNTLCNMNVTPVSTACTLNVQGRVIYALMRLPDTGTYTFSVAHDDEVEVNFSTDYTSDFRSAAYDVPIGALASYTSNDTSYESLSNTVTSSSNNRCVLVRIYWVNAGGINHLRLRWTRPGGTSEFIPASALFDPRAGASGLGCSGTVQYSGTSLRVTKIVDTPGRASPSDQFTLSVRSGSTVVGSVTTAGSTTGTASAVSTAAIAASVNTSYTINDAMAAGSGYSIGAYSPTISCTRNGTNFSPGGTTGAWTVSATGSNQQILCTVTNTRRFGYVQIGKQWVDAAVGDSTVIPAPTGTMASSTPYMATAAAANQTSNHTAFQVYVGEAFTLQPETLNPSNSVNYLGMVSCGSVLASTSARVANTVTLPESFGAGTGQTLNCLYANTRIRPLTVVKTSVAAEDPIRGTTNPLMIPGGRVSYSIRVTNPSMTSVDANSIVIIDPTPQYLDFRALDAVSAGSGPIRFTASTSGLTFVFSGLNSNTDDVDFSNNGGTSWGYTPVPGVGGIDASVTHVRIRPRGTMAPNSNFTVSFDYLIE